VLDASDPDAGPDEPGRALDGEPVPALVVDALLGTGFVGDVRSPLVELIALARSCAARGARVLALDVPSGLDCDTGRAAGTVLRADATATFVARKIGLDRAPQLAGEVVVVPIGVPRAWLERVVAEEAAPG
jgi:NAD(P)H-hydrate epimerase